MNFYILGLCGSKGVGKDTAFEELYKSFKTTEFYEHKTAIPFAFADRLKEMLTDFFVTAGVDIKTCSRETKEVIRPLMIELGETGRRVDKDFWVNEVFRQIKVRIAELKSRFGECQFHVFFVIKDVRYANEIRKILNVKDEIPDIKRSSVVRLLREDAPIVEKTEKRSFAAIEKIYELPEITNDMSPHTLGVLVHAYCDRMTQGANVAPYEYRSWFDRFKRKLFKFLWQRRG